MGLGRETKALGEYREAGLGMVGLHEAFCDGKSLFKQAGYMVYCSGACGDQGGGKKGQGGGGLAIGVDSSRSTTVKVTLKLRGCVWSNRIYSWWV